MEEVRLKILVLNCGSSSVKYQLMDMDTEKVLASGKFERIGEKESFNTHKVNGQKIEVKHYAPDHAEAIDFVLKQFTNPEYKVIDSLDEIYAIGHRVVNGGELIKESMVVTKQVEEDLKTTTPFAPLHNPAAILGIEACKKVMPGKPMVVVVDTAFHQTMPKENYIYPIPYKYYKEDGVRKYGAHGTSHMFVSQKVAKIMGKDVKDLKIVTCHLGQGASICAVKEGKCIDTSMGLTPLGGIPMVTRSGDLDPSVVLYIMKKHNLSPQEMEDILNKESGVMGISGLDPDFRVIEQEIYNGNESAQVAINVFESKIAEYIARYAAQMGGIDVIVFTGGIGENQINVRKRILERLTFMGVNVDAEANNVKGEDKLITTPDSKVLAYIVPTDEELMIARETLRLTK